MTPLLALRGLGVWAGGQALLQDVSLRLAPGGALCVLGQSGSGKSLLVQAVLAQLPAGLRATGEVVVQGRVLDETARRAAWGRQLAVLPQEPVVALNPCLRADSQVAEVHRWVLRRPAAQAWAAARQALQALGLPPAVQSRWPHQLSGGMAQRVALAAALAGGAPLVLADEPTKGLDPQRRDEVVAQLQAVRAAGGAVLVVTHDLTVARALGDQVLVVNGQGVVEQGPADEVLQRPRQAYTRALLAADPSAWAARPAARPPAAAATPLLQAQGLRWAGRGPALHGAAGLDLTVQAGERWALLGPSGVGKTSLGQLLLGLARPDAGQVQRASGLGPQAFQKLYQDPISAFAPQRSLRRSLQALLRLHRLPERALWQGCEALGLSPDLLARWPQAVSGGELQRVALLRVLLLRPALIFADEPTSRLDPLTQQRVLGVLDRELQARGTALLLVTHEPGLARHLTDRALTLG
ncbi:ABC transporter ATP-binding protein [Ideonella livida]|uniref:ABC transporter ATP-binding protein n=1 Tax=Ideonella livida TaxID=2707176 RepID=A0A7C9PI13_9BURK|nr:ATP-binding cassette domain-containing protein [Ideonella livida]NDY92535.1 ABC transporter ATP-binding protein [Ideonella livida]